MSVVWQRSKDLTTIGGDYVHPEDAKTLPSGVPGRVTPALARASQCVEVAGRSGGKLSQAGLLENSGRTPRYKGCLPRRLTLYEL